MSRANAHLIRFADVVQLEERDVANVEAMGSSPIVRTTQVADVVELADTPARGAGSESYAGSSPAVGTNV